MKTSIGKRLLFLLSLVLTGGAPFVQAQQTSTSMLWEVTMERDTMYVLGSMHLGKDLILTKSTKDAILKSDVIVGELDLEDTLMMSSAMQAMQKGMYLDGTTLRDHIRADTFKMLKKAFARRGKDITEYEMMKPWMIYMMMSVTEAGESGYSSTEGIEMQIQALAKEHKKKFMGLETAVDQVLAFDKLQTKTQIDMLIEVLKSPKKKRSSDKSIDKLSEAYKRGDTTALGSMIMDEFGSTAQEVRQRLITDRNKNWMTKIEAFRGTDQRYFIVVGAGHLLGEEGLLQLLKNKGYALRRV